MTDAAGNFLDLPPPHADLASARYVVLPVPYEGTVTYGRGTADGPAAILEASEQVELFDEELLAEFYQAGVATAPAVPAAETPEAMAERVGAAAEEFIDRGQFLLTLGGEHGITPPLVAAARRRFGEISVVQIDAHADLRDTYDGTRFSHACVMRRVLEITPRIAQVGIRNVSREEFDACGEQARNFITPPMARTDPTWIDRALALLGDRVYVTVDVDGFDPAEAPGVGTPEPGGLRWGEVTALLRRVCTARQVVAADIVEVRPLPPSNVTEFLAARLAYKIVAYTQLAG